LNAGRRANQLRDFSAVGVRDSPKSSMIAVARKTHFASRLKVIGAMSPRGPKILLSYFQN
jgi:hypothetical protein